MPGRIARVRQHHNVIFVMPDACKNLIGSIGPVRAMRGAMPMRVPFVVAQHEHHIVAARHTCCQLMRGD
jgi:hypothetical protein